MDRFATARHIDMRRRSRGSGVRAAVSTACVLLCAAAPPAMAMAMAMATQHSDVDLIESLARARPVEAADKTQQLLAGTAPFGDDRLDLLTIRGMALGVSQDAEAAGAVAAELEHWEGNSKAAASAMLIHANVELQAGHLDAADQLVSSALTRLPADAPEGVRYRMDLFASDLKDSLGKLGDSVRLGHDAVAIADRMHSDWRRADARSNLSYSYMDAGQADLAVSLAASALEIATACDDPMSLAVAHTMVGIMEALTGDVDRQQAQDEAAIAAAHRAGSKLKEATYVGNMADNFLKRQNYTSALHYAEQSLQLAIDAHSSSARILALCNMGLAQIGLHHFPAGRQFVDACIDDTRRLGLRTMAEQRYAEIGAAFEAAGDLPDAIANLHLGRELSATLAQKATQKEVLEAQERYAAEQRARDLVLLDRESKLTEQRLLGNKLQQGLWWLLALSLGAFFVVFAWLFRRVRLTRAALLASSEQLRISSECDPLTGIANRRHVQTALRGFGAEGRFQGAIYLIDVDHFKRINDNAGHAVGDAVLIDLAARLAAVMREDDVIARWGGEEFIVVTPASAEQRPEVLAQRLLAAVSGQPVHHAGQAMNVTASIGFAAFAGQSLPWQSALGLVDAALYMAKAQGRNRACGLTLPPACDDTRAAVWAKDLAAASRSGDIAVATWLGASASPATLAETVA